MIFFAADIIIFGNKMQQELISYLTWYWTGSNYSVS